MPYIICVNQPGCLPEQAPYAVATLEEARDAVATELEGSPAWIGTTYPFNDLPRLTSKAESLPEHGGTVGPLPDGYVIDVRRVSWDEFMEGADGAVNAAIDAYNGN